MCVCAHSTVQDSGTARPRRRTLRHIKPHWLGARVSHRVHRVRRMRHVKAHRLGTRQSNRMYRMHPINGIDLEYVYQIACIACGISNSISLAYTHHIACIACIACGTSNRIASERTYQIAFEWGGWDRSDLFAPRQRARARAKKKKKKRGDRT